MIQSEENSYRRSKPNHVEITLYQT